MNELWLQIHHALWEDSPEPVLLADQAGRVLAANRACLELAGLPAEELSGKHFSMLMPPESRLNFLSACQQHLDQQLDSPFTFEIDTSLRNGRSCTLEISCLPLRRPADNRNLLLRFRDITERKQAEAQLRQSEELFRTLADYSSDWVYWVDPEGNYIYISPSVERITGYPPEAFFQKPSLVFEITHPDDRSVITDTFQTSLISSKPLRAEFRIRTPQNVERWIDHVSLAIIAPDGRYLGRRGSNRDFTRQKALQESLRRQVELEQILAEISTLFLNVSAAQLNSAIQQALHMVGEHAQANRCFILDTSAIGSQVRISYQWRSGQAAAQDEVFQQLIQRYPPGGEYWLVKRDVLQLDLEKCACCPPETRASACTAIVAAPLMRAGELSGYIGMTASKATPTWGPSDHLLLRLTGELVISALERQHYELELERTSRQLSVILESVADAITVLDASGRLVYANTAAAQAAGLRVVDELFQDNSWSSSYQILDANGELLPASELPPQSLLAGKPQSDQVLRMRFLKDRQERWKMVRSRPVFDNQGRVQYVVTISHDITELKEAETALRSSSTLYQTTIDAIEDGLLVTDRDLTILLCNRAMRRWVEKLTPGVEPVGARLFSLFHFFSPALAQECARAFSTRQSRIYEEHFSLPEGDVFTQTYLIPIIQDDQAVRVITLVRDVTIQRNEEHRIQAAAWRADLLAGLSRCLMEAGFNPSAIYEAIAGYLCEKTGASCLLHTRYPRTRQVELIEARFAGGVENTALLVAFSERLNDPTSSIAQVFQSTSPQVLSPASAGLPAEASNAPLNEILLLPLTLQGQVSSVITLLDHGKSPFLKNDGLLFLQDVANRISLSLESAQLYLLQTQRARELDALNHATSALLTTLDLESLLGAILDAAKTAIPSAEKGEIRLLSANTGELELRAATAFQDQRISFVPAAELEAPFRQAIASRQPLLVHAASNEQDRPTPVLIAPLYNDARPLGVLVLSTSRLEAFNEADRALLGALATTAAAALQNARLHAQIQRQAITDELTSLYNRRGLVEVGEREVTRAHRFKHPLAAIMADIDDFKRVNDTYGHPCGDQVLRQVARCLEANLRSIDLLGRYGGDEFFIMLPETDLPTALEVAERLASRVRQLYIRYNNCILQTSLSIGVTLVTERTTNLEALFAQADQSLYRAKQRGKDCVEIG